MLKKIAIVAPIELTVVAFLSEHIKVLQEKYDVTVIVNTENESFLAERGVPVRVVRVGIKRKIGFLSDFLTLIKLVAIFRKNKFDLVFSVTPKAGLLSMLAARISGIQFRLHMFTGQVWAVKKGVKRLFLKIIDVVIVKLSNHLLVDSFSQLNFIENEGVVKKGCATVLAAGSICGVDINRFNRDDEYRQVFRSQNNIDDTHVVFLYLGRLNKDKGILDLARAVSQVARKNKSVRLLIVGPDEGGMKEQVKQVCHACLNKVIFIDYTSKPEKYMSAADVFCLPSYREGFGSAVIEAAACGLPSLVSRIYGLTDAVKDSKTGFFHDAGDIDGIERCIFNYLDNRELIHEMGQAAKERVREMFAQELVVSALVSYIDAMLISGDHQK